MDWDNKEIILKTKSKQEENLSIEKKFQKTFKKGSLITAVNNFNRPKKTGAQLTAFRTKIKIR